VLILLFGIKTILKQNNGTEHIRHQCRKQLFKADTVF
jgi:hypothetical protein